MECFWCLYSHWQPDGDSDQQNTSVFYVCINSYDGLPDYHLYGAGFLAEYAKVYLGSEEKSVVLFVKLSLKKTLQKRR
jgi:hypothetical protein